MKANKAPEKIYVHEASAPELTEKLPYHIEYTRTDVIIEKAVEWLKSHSENDYVEYHMGVTIMHKDKFIKDFRDEMERI